MQAGLYARKMNKSIANSGASNAFHIVEIGRQIKFRTEHNFTVYTPYLRNIQTILIQNSWMRDSRCKHECVDRLSKGVTILKMKQTNINKLDIVDM